MLTGRGADLILIDDPLLLRILLRLLSNGRAPALVPEPSLPLVIAEIAREMAAFLWAIAHHVPPAA